MQATLILLLVAAVGGDLGALALVDDRVGPVEGLDHLQALGDLALELGVAQVPGSSSGYASGAPAGRPVEADLVDLPSTAMAGPYRMGPSTIACTSEAEARSRWECTTIDPRSTCQ